MRIAALVKQIPQFEAMALDEDGRLRRDGVELEMNAYCRRAVSKACELAADRPGSSVTVLTLGPESADDVLREAIAWGLDRDVAITGVLVSDPAFAGSDTLATARALAAALARTGPYDLVLAGRNSVDADTGQVGPEVAELLDLPFAAAVKHLAIEEGFAHVRCEHDDGWFQCDITLPAVLSCAERLCEPSKVPPEGRAAVPAGLVTTLRATDLGPGPWGEAASPTRVGATKVHQVERARAVHADAPLTEQVARAVATLRARGALDGSVDDRDDGWALPPAGRRDGPVVAVLVEPRRAKLTRELLGAAARLASEVGGSVTALLEPDAEDLATLASHGADAAVRWHGPDLVEEDLARALAEWADDAAPWAILAPGTVWGREVASRAAARLGAGLTGDAVDLDVEGDRLVAWKPAFGGALVAAITATSPVQLVTVRAGVLPVPARRDPVFPDLAGPGSPPSVHDRVVVARGRVRPLARTRDDDLDVLAEADAVVGVGRGVDPSEYPMIDPLLRALGAELGATRKVTDEGWLPRARQIGITGRSIAPRLYVAIGTSGKYNHMVGVRAAGTILAVDRSPDALVFRSADLGIVGDWHDVVPLLVHALRGET